MQQVRSWLTAGGSRSAAWSLALGSRPASAVERLRSRYPASFNVRLARKFSTGLAVVSLALAGYSYGPSFSAAAQQSASPATTPATVAQTVTAQASEVRARDGVAEAGSTETSAPMHDSEIVARIPMIEPADEAPLTASDFDIETEKPETAAAADETETLISTIALPDEAPKPQLRPESAPNLTGRDLLNVPLAETLSGTDREVAERLREIIAGGLGQYLDRREARANVEAFYRDRGFAPLWIEQGTQSERAAAAASYLQTVHEDGFDPADYPAPHIGMGMDSWALAEAELELTNSVLRFARHAQVGRVHFTRVSSEIEFQLDPPAPAAVLEKLATESDTAAALASYHPPHPQYAALKKKLAELRKETQETEVIRIPEGPILRPGMEDSRVPLLRKRLDIAGDPDGRLYDDTVFEAVREFQRSAGLTPDGLFGPASLRAINGPNRANTVDIIIANMERWRWISRDLGEFYSMVNIPDFTIRVVHNGKKVWETKTVVGRQSRQTPVISDEMSFITVNPTWNVPPGIIANDYLPALRQDPTALERIGVRVEQNRDGTFRMYQPPGDNNALGRLRFNFPNKYLVYQHDTPDRHLFQRDVRAYSSGCMRVEDPLKYAEILLSYAAPDGGYSRERLRAMYGPSERNIRFDRRVPVHLTYQTAFVDDAGKLQIRDDIYGHDARLISVLKGTDRKVADVAVPVRRVQVPREELRLPDSYTYRYGTRHGAYYGTNPIEDFFRRIFQQ